MATFIKRPTYNSPKGVFQYPSLSKPDFGNEKFPKPDGEFKTALIVPAEEAQALINTLTPVWEAAIAAGKEDFAKLAVPIRKKLGSVKEQPFFEIEYDKDSEQETGNVIFKFKTKYKIVDKKTNEVRFNKVGLFDSKGKPLPASVAIYGGTIGKVAFQASPYFVAGQGMAGISLRLSAAQVIELVGPGSRSANSYGFGQEEGFDAEDEESFPAATGEAQAAANGNSEDF